MFFNNVSSANFRRSEPKMKFLGKCSQVSARHLGSMGGRAFGHYAVFDVRRADPPIRRADLADNTPRAARRSCR